MNVNLPVWLQETLYLYNLSKTEIPYIIIYTIMVAINLPYSDIISKDKYTQNIPNTEEERL